MRKTGTLLGCLAKGLRPTKREGIIPFLTSNIRLPFSKRSPIVDFDGSPFLRDILDALENPDIRVVNFLGATGSGKSTLINCYLAWCIAKRGGNVLHVSINEEMRDAFANYELDLMLKHSLPLKALLPSSIGAYTKTQIIFPNMVTLKLVSGHIGGLQGFSALTTITDETFAMKDFVLRELQYRLHDAPNGKMLNCSQGGSSGTAWDDAVTESNILLWHNRCVSCHQLFPAISENLKYTIHKLGEGEEAKLDWEKTYATITMVCPNCNFSHFDDPLTRREVCCSGAFEKIKTDGKPENLTFRLPAASCHWIPWKSIVAEKIIADQLKEIGQEAAYVAFTQKRDAAFVDPSGNDSEFLEIETFNTEELAKDKTPINGRIIGVDISKTCLWVAVVEFRADGRICLLDYQRLLTFEEVFELQQKYKVNSNHVIIDVRYRQVQAFAHVRKYDWRGIMGSDRKYFLHHNQRIGQKLYLPWSPKQTTRSQTGLKQEYVLLADETLKIAVHELIESGVLMIPDDISAMAKKQLTQEIVETEITKTGRKIKRLRAKSDNIHIFDCLKQAIYAGMALRYIAQPEIDSPPEYLEEKQQKEKAIG